MEGSEGTSQTELYTGWSSVVHQPCEDLEESDLPSTVDITAFSTGLSVEPSNSSGQTLNADSDSDSEAESSNSGSEASHSGSQSDSSESDSSTTSQESTSRSSSPAEFSVTSSQTDGLRLTIATVKKPCGSPCADRPPSKPSEERSRCSSESAAASSASESESRCSTGSKEVARAKVKTSEINKDSPIKRNAHRAAGGRSESCKRIESKPLSVKRDCTSGKVTSKVKTKLKGSRKMNSSLVSRECGYCSSDGGGGGGDDSAAMLASCSLQEIRQEDLAAILPDECDAFGAFEQGKGAGKRAHEEAEMSESDMELPHQAVDALIQRTTESSSESDHELPNPPPALYANSLLQQFEAQTQMLSTQLTTPKEKKPTPQSGTGSKNGRSEEKTDSSDKSKRRRGRPKKTAKLGRGVAAKQAKINGNSYGLSPNVSPDSGIQNSPDHISSPEPVSLQKVPKEDSKEKAMPDKKTSQIEKEKKINKLSVTTDRLDRHFYGHSEKTLYPPKRRTGRTSARKETGRVSRHSNKATRAEEKVQNKNDKNVREKKNRTTQESAETKTVENKSNGANHETKRSKSSFLFEICERVSKRLEMGGKLTYRPAPTGQNGKVQKNSKQQKNHRQTVPLAKGKCDAKTKAMPLKNAKVMHSKHRHKVHKKRKFKILKPLASISQDPKLNAEIEKLIVEFTKLCITNNLKPSKENVPEILKTLKRVSKKRKTNEYERKKKKQNVSATVNKIESSNEQRLPLKKRHYHVSATETAKPEEGDKENPETEEIRSEVKNGKVMPSKSCSSVKACPVGQPSPKHAHSVKTAQNFNNNDFESENVDVHIDEAIEACINRFADAKTDTRADTASVKVVASQITATTPKKRHRLAAIESCETSKDEASKREEKADDVSPESTKKPKTSLESVVTELKMKRNLSPSSGNATQSQKKIESVAQMITRKKNRLEDLTSNLVLKINPSLDVDKKKCPDGGRASVIKYPVCKKTKPTELERLDTITSAKPTGIFMPTVEIELPDASLAGNAHTREVTPTPVALAPNLEVDKTPPLTGKKKVRKRRAPNRTGFPTVKKKKKRCIPPTEPERPSMVPSAEEVSKLGDRVPLDGEEYTSFVSRTENGNISTVSTSTSPNQDVSTRLRSSSDDPSRWEAMSDCDSLPQDERNELDLHEFLLRPDYPTPRECDSPATSVDTRVSDRTIAGGVADLDDLPIGKRLELMEGGAKSSGKRRLRDRSSASSGERKMSDDRSTTSGEDKKGGKRAPRWKKRYLVAGLFSDYYKEDDVVVRQKRRENVGKSSKALTYDPAEHPHGLLPPPHHCGRYLRCRRVSFQLPYDLWWRHTHSQLPGRDAVPSWNYRKVRTNVYNVKANTSESQTCNCAPSQKCGDDCINRLVLSECPANVHRCLNQRIQRHDWAPGLEKFMTDDKGWGVRTKQPIKSNEFILEYVGEVVSDHEFKERMAGIYANDTHHYCLHLDAGMVIDGHRMGGDGRFVNHSCEPNCEMQKWSVNGQSRMALFAQRDIEAGEELTYDYNFSLFNPAEGQECKCGSEMCRGVIGGKSQRVRQLPLPQASSKPNGGRVGRPRKVLAKKTNGAGVGDSKESTKEENQQQQQHNPNQQTQQTPLQPVAVPIQVKPISHQQKCYILEHHCFLLRNINKVRKVRDRAVGVQFVNGTSTPNATSSDHGSAAFLNHLNALQKPRNMKTRRIAQAEDNPDFNRSVKVASVLKDIYDFVVNFKDENGAPLASALMTLPSKRKNPELYQVVDDPIDFATVEQNIARGAYRTTESFDDDMNRVLRTFVKFRGRSSAEGVAAARLRRVYDEGKRDSLSKFQDLVGARPPPTFVSRRDKGEEEDIIRCICGMYHDEGLMIQCERCLVWQHCECVRADPAAPSYHCEKCAPREVEYEIPMDEFTEHGHRYYMTLMRGDLQLRQGDTVYVLRDIPIPGTDQKHTYKTIGKLDYNDLDIFRIERLWKDSRTGQRLAYGHHYLRPHETYHEPTRKFFPNEVMRVPLYEAVPVELIIEQCWVLDLNTYCKGRPIGAEERHVYICEYRVDKSARLFHKVSRAKYTVCTKSYVFERFAERLRVSRTYTPHDLGEAASTKSKPRKAVAQEERGATSARQAELPAAPPQPKVKNRNEQKSRLNKILLTLLSKMPTKQAVDLSYLLEGGRRRNKTKSTKSNQ